MPSIQQAIEIRESIKGYLEATFAFREPDVQEAFYDLVLHPERGIFKGPYVKLQLPFVQATEAAQAAVPLTIKPTFAPYQHQVAAWQRLATQGQPPQPTLVTTGTGSGKTEAFLYPMLDYCHQQRGRKGIKVIILYPMNALATDQAQRLAAAIHNNPLLKGEITAGLFIGLGNNPETHATTMGPNHIIEHRKTMLDSPPDILLTNFKMLDYGLLRAEHDNLWETNRQAPDLLRFLVLDELHTYDGAQGTDVANLVRRLKLKLKLAPGQLCPVGTSATLGNDKNAKEALCRYATRLFGEPITKEAIIGEQRQGHHEFFNKNDGKEDFMPSAHMLPRLLPQEVGSYEQYMQQLETLWQVEANNLASGLRSYGLVNTLVKVCQQQQEPWPLSELLTAVAQEDERLGRVMQTHGPAMAEAVVLSLLALLGKATDPRAEKPRPWVYLQAQLWVRELSGVLRTVGQTPRFVWREEVNPAQTGRALPAWQCRDCNASGWLAVKQDHKQALEKSVQAVYSEYFAQGRDVYLVNRTTSFDRQAAQESGYAASARVHDFENWVNPENLEFTAGEEHNGDVLLTGFQKLTERHWQDPVCPECQSRHSLFLIGQRLPTLSSVGISQALATDLAPQPEAERKLLAFGNGVQDAAHQAGFIEARNYNFAFRTALQTVINQHPQGSKTPLTLEALPQQFTQYWKTHADPRGQNALDAYYHRFYPSDLRGKSAPEDYRQGNGYSPAFAAAFDLRMAWEIFAEFGYNARIGRTLEKTGTTAIYAHPTLLQQAVGQLYQWLGQQESQQGITENALLAFTTNVLYRVRTRGGVNHPFLTQFRTQRPKRDSLNCPGGPHNFLHRYFGPRTRLPRMLSPAPTKGLELDSTHTKTHNWYHAHFKKTFDKANPSADFRNEFFAQWLHCLEQAGVMHKAEANGVPNYALQPEALAISTHVHFLQCPSCKSQLPAGPEALAQTLEGSACLTFRCTGHYTMATAPNTNYYQKVYNRARSPRIYAADHTGLLERSVRERLEKSFKERPNYQDKNLLVATSTLEMGIDIGDLNIVFTHGTPPTPANFMQRIGRAGRKTGSALVVNYVQNRPHDQYYFQAPQEMMAGKVSTPGVFLEARAILRRHYMAFGLDSWATAEPLNNKIPHHVADLNLVPGPNPSPFLTRLLHYLKARQDSLWQHFTLQYPEKEMQPVLATLHQHLQQGALYQQLTAELVRLRNELQHLAEQIQEAETMRKGLGKNDDQYQLLTNELHNLRGLAKSLRQRSVLEHLTHQGLLPNYAFPDGGVTLAAQIHNNTAPSSQHSPTTDPYELVRPGKQALHELAPGNQFYSQGYQFTISGLQATDLGHEDWSHAKRFCSRCDALYPLTHPHGKATQCPKCGDPSYGSPANVHTFARMGTVRSFGSRKNATITDSADERVREQYRQTTHFAFAPAEKSRSMALKDIPFGIEWAPTLDITFTNLGPNTAHSADLREINGKEVPQHGFVTCTHCGKVTGATPTETTKNHSPYHYPYCKYHRVDYTGEPGGPFAALFLYHQLPTEALKILLPVQQWEPEATLLMYQAGITLGLKHYYQSTPQHLALAPYQEFNPRTQQFDRYLVLYDTIPGGTGYLEKLFDPHQFRQLLEKALEALDTCPCQHHGQDGCYHCVYTYANQGIQHKLSRRETAAWLRRILAKGPMAWKHYPEGLATVTEEGQVAERELELRLLSALKRYAQHQTGWSLQEQPNSQTHTLTFTNNQNTTLVYSLEAPAEPWSQNQHGIPYRTEVDFVLQCQKAQINGTPIAPGTIPQVALMADTHRHHASKARNQMPAELKARIGVQQQPQYQVWVITEQELERFEAHLAKNNTQAAQDIWAQANASYQTTALQIAKATKLTPAEQSNVQQPNSLLRLLQWLREPITLNPNHAKPWLSYLASFQPKALGTSYPPQELAEALQGQASTNNYFYGINKTLDTWLPVQGLPEITGMPKTLLVNLAQKKAIACLGTEHQKPLELSQWDALWSWFNMAQLFELAPWATPEQTTETPKSTIPLAETLALYPTAYHPLLTTLHQQGHLATEAQVDALNLLTDASGKVLAEAELIVHHRKVAFAPYDQTSHNTLQAQGYQVLAEEALKNYRP